MASESNIFECCICFVEKECFVINNVSNCSCDDKICPECYIKIIRDFKHCPICRREILRSDIERNIICKCIFDGIDLHKQENNKDDIITCINKIMKISIARLREYNQNYIELEQALNDLEQAVNEPEPSRCNYDLSTILLIAYVLLGITTIIVIVTGIIIIKN